MIYFDHAATGGYKPECVKNAVRAALEICANPGRSGHKLSVSCANAVLETRIAVCRYFGGYAMERTVFTKNCTEAMNIALFGILRSGDHVVTTAMEHNSVLRPLEQLKKSGVIEYNVCPIDGGNVRAEDIAARIREQTKAVVVTAASNVTGSAPPLHEIRRAIPRHVLLIVDGAQAGGHLPLNMKDGGMDALTLAGHKGLHAIQGTGVLLFSDRVSINPLLFGGTGSESFSLDMPPFYPDALEAGTLSFPAIASLRAGIRYLERRGKVDGEKLLKLCARLHEGIARLPSYRLYSKINPCGIVAFSHRAIPSERMSDLLSERYGFAVRGGLHCAPKMHEGLKTTENGLVRASLSPFNTPCEAEEFLAVLKEIG